MLESGEPGAEPKAAEVGVDLASLPASAEDVNSLAWPLIDPERNWRPSRARSRLRVVDLEREGAARRPVNCGPSGGSPYAGYARLRTPASRLPDTSTKGG